MKNMKNMEQGKWVDQLDTTSKAKDPSQPPSPQGRPNRKSSLGPGTRGERNERFGNEVG